MLFLLLLACDPKGAMDEGPYCEGTRSPLALDEAAPNGVVPAAVLAWAETPYADTLTWASGGTTPLSLQATHTDAAEWVDEETVYPEGGGAQPAIGIECEDWLAVPVDLDLATDDGAFADRWATELVIASEDAAAFAVDLMAVALAGTFEPADWPEGEYDRLDLSVTGTLTAAGSSGTIGGSAIHDEGCEPDGTCSASAQEVRVATWGPASE